MLRRHSQVEKDGESSGGRTQAVTSIDPGEGRDLLELRQGSDHFEIGF
jgi:hypothetical protein